MSVEIPVIVPHESVNDETVKLVRWLVEPGQLVEAGQALAEVEGSKATFPIVAPQPGTVRFRATVGNEVPVGAPLCHLMVADGAAVKAEQAQSVSLPIAVPGPAIPLTAKENTAVSVKLTAQPTQQATAHLRPATQRISQRAQELIRQHGLDTASFSNLALVRESDVLKALGRSDGNNGTSKSTPHAPREAIPHAPREEYSPPGATAAVLTPKIDLPTSGNFEVFELSRQKKTENRYLRNGAAATIPSQVSTVVSTMGLRESLSREAAGTSLTALVTYEIARLLRQFPELNGFFANQNAHRYCDVNVGIAVAGEFGLKVPVVREADKKSLGQVAQDVRDLLVAYSENNLKPEQLTGGTFTVTDLSAENVFALTPLIVQGQAAILGIGAETRFGNDSESMFSLTLSFDHQLADGLTAAKFLAKLSSRLSAHEATLRRSAPAKTCSRCGRAPEELDPRRAFLLQAVNGHGDPALLCAACFSGF